jgi:hypothetical protein
MGHLVSLLSIEVLDSLILSIQDVYEIEFTVLLVLLYFLEGLLPSLGMQNGQVLEVDCLFELHAEKSPLTVLDSQGLTELENGESLGIGLGQAVVDLLHSLFKGKLIDFNLFLLVEVHYSLE